MSDKMRWRYGDTNPVVAAVDSATVIEIGDLLYQDWGDERTGKVAYPASMTPCEGRTDLTQESFASDFLGVAMRQSRSGETAPVRVATTGVFEFDCPNGTFELGALVGVDDCHGLIPDTEPHLLNQQVAKVTSSKYAIARVAKREASPSTSVLVDICSTVMRGGIKGSSPSGV